MDWKQYKALGAEAFLTGRSVSVATALCVVLLAFSAARLTWMVIPLPADGAGAPPPLASAPIITSPQGDSLSMRR